MKSLLQLGRLVALCICLVTAAAGQQSGVPSASTVEVATDATPTTASATISIPGPFTPFLRMAGISQKVTADEVLPLLSRNIVVEGYSQGRPTEFLILVNRYIRQARELSSLATDGTIRVTNCADAQPLLSVLGYRMRHECGSGDVALETANPERAFLTVDSGFPLPELEQALSAGKPFDYPYRPSVVPAILSEADWTSAGRMNPRVSSMQHLDALLRDQTLARLYWAFSQLDPHTRTVLRSSVGIEKLYARAAVLDFYGSRIQIQGDRVIVPGGTAAEAAWKQLVGASPESPGKFVNNLLSKDHGWLAALFDVLARAKPEQQAYFTDPKRLPRFYEALFAANRTEDATSGAFRPAPQLLLLVTRLQRASNGEPVVPGNIEVWKEILRQKGDSTQIRKWSQRADRITSPDQLMEAMFGLARVRSDIGPLEIYLSLCELDGRRAPNNRLSSDTVSLLAKKFVLFGSQYRIFSEFPELTNESIALFVNIAQSLDAISSQPLRGNALGMFQAEVGLWQIFSRQGQIPTEKMNDSWQRMVRPFERIQSSTQLYDAGRTGLKQLAQATTGKEGISQQELVDLLAGPPQSTSDGKRMHDEFATRILSILDSQRLVSIDVIIALGQALDEKSQGKQANDGILILAGELREFQMPQPIFSSTERTEWAAGIYNNTHTDSEMRTDLSKVFKPSASRAQALEAKGQLSSFFRDILVGLNYAYYEPPGAQMLHHNPLFIRSHDFAAETVGGIKGVWQAPQMFGEGSPAGGGAHLVGSLADLPYVLAQIEEDFIAPENIQALIWRELVPSLLTSAVLPRWWGIPPEEMHAVALYQRAGEEILVASSQDEMMRKRVLTILSERMSPLTLQQVEVNLKNGRQKALMTEISPADTFYLEADFRERHPETLNGLGAANQELQSLSQRDPGSVSWERLSRDFGTPHPMLAQTYARELLNCGPIPAFEGYASRLLGESWDSSNLYWARLLDESGYSPVEMNRLVPQLTHRMVEKVAATNFDDWPALIRAMRETADEFRQGKLKVAGARSGLDGDVTARQ